MSLHRLAQWTGACNLIKIIFMFAAIPSSLYLVMAGPTEEQQRQKLLYDSQHLVKWSVFRDMQPLVHAWSDTTIVILGPDPEEYFLQKIAKMVGSGGKKKIHQK